MADQNEHFAQAGTWDHLSSTANFCEEDYAVTQYVAEFINTLSNIAYVYCALYYPSSAGSRRRLDSMSVALIVVGITSALYHATLRQSMMYADDFSMWLIVACILRSLCCHGQSPTITSLITAVISLGFCIMTIIYLRSGNILIHTAFFAFLVQLIWPRTLFLIYYTQGRSQREKNRLIQRFWKAAIILVVAFIIWNIDLQKCPQLREIRKSLGLPWAWALELHGWWHILTAVGAAEYIRLARHLSQEEIQILKHEFDQYDQDRGGNITVEEFGRVMKKTGQNPTDEELAQIIKEVDLDGDGTINFDEFIAMMTGGAAVAPPVPEKEGAPAAGSTIAA
ncbi:hypothetical protein G7Y89_g12499 [Cudoniella acicularis]|uniref:EF-hand domain-containing protein n=1 Tax=Cudoniella acicularis TaxID=354080 RepID=A0A8H4VZ39_9HELO|nr:hypothetical protein G7Y89_g12499 [Cudoniella acicularis]